MITGVHAIVYDQHPEEVRAFFSDVLELRSVDAGHGWLIFALPPAELAVHPHDGEPKCELYLMCDDLSATMDELKLKGVEFARPVSEERWGRLTSIRLPGGTELGLYEPRHASPLMNS